MFNFSNRSAAAFQRAREILAEHGTYNNAPIAGTGDELSEQLRLLIFTPGIPGSVKDEIAALRPQLGIGKGHRDRAERAAYLASRK